MKTKNQGVEEEKKARALEEARKNNATEWYGYDDKDFQKWWHRDGKELYGGRDIDNAQQAQEVYEYWVSIGKPTIK